MLRVDGRTADELRPVTITTDYVVYPEASELIAVGETKVLCNITVEEGVPGWRRAQGAEGGWLTAEYALLPRSTHRRTPRETLGLRGRTQEIRRLIGRSLRAALDLGKLGERTCIVDCDVLQADGGTRSAAVTGGYVALVIALRKLIRGGLLSPEVLKTAVAAISAGVVGGQPVLDLCYEEDSIAEVDVNMVMNASGEFIEVQGTAEGAPFSRATLDELLDLAQEGIGKLLAIQRAVLDETP